MRDRLARHPEAMPALVRSRVEEPVVLQKPTTTMVLNKTIADALGIPLPDAERRGALAEHAAEGTEERVR
jgi:hypothetical protein